VAVGFGRSLEDLTVERHPGMAVKNAARLVVPLGADVQPDVVALSIDEAVEGQGTHVAGIARAQPWNA